MSCFTAARDADGQRRYTARAFKPLDGEIWVRACLRTNGYLSISDIGQIRHAVRDEGLLEFSAAETDQNVFANLQYGEHLDGHFRKLSPSFGRGLNVVFAVDDPFVL